MPLSSDRIDPTDLSSLPSPPTVLLKLLKAFGDEDIDISVLAKICEQDAALSVRILALANSAAFRRAAPVCHRIDQAIVRIGLRMIKTIALAAALMQSFSRLEISQRTLDAFWMHSLICAQLSRQLARITGYSQPDEAYLCGLFHDLGKLIIYAQHGDAHGVNSGVAASPSDAIACERSLFETDHCQLGAALMSYWKLDPLLADAARYHHDSLVLIDGAHPLIRLVYVANALDSKGWDQRRAMNAGDTLFGLQPELLTRIHEEARARAAELAPALGIGVPDEGGRSTAISAAPELQDRVRDRSMVNALIVNLNDCEDEPELLAAISRLMTLLFAVERVRFFVPVDEAQLQGLDPVVADSGFDRFQCAIESGSTLIGRAFVDGVITRAAPGDGELSVFDRQVAAGAGLVCLPLVSGGVSHAVAVLETNALQLHRLMLRADLLMLFGTEAGGVLGRLRARADRRRRQDSDRQLLSHSQLHEAVHEINNPLGIVENYLDLLTTRLEGDPVALADMHVLREEIDRVGNMLVRLLDTVGPSNADAEHRNVASGIMRLATLVGRALCRPRGIDLEIHCPDSLPRLALNEDSLRQILINLMRNAVEAVADGGRIEIEVNPGINIGGRIYVELAVSDDGPGVQADMISQLFHPVQSSKAGHYGVGLTVVRNLVEMAGGMVGYCNGKAGGGRFQVLLPLFIKSTERGADGPFDASSV